MAHEKLNQFLQNFDPRIDWNPTTPNSMMVSKPIPYFAAEDFLNRFKQEFGDEVAIAFSHSPQRHSQDTSLNIHLEILQLVIDRLEMNKYVQQRRESFQVRSPAYQEWLEKVRAFRIKSGLFKPVAENNPEQLAQNTPLSL